MKRRVAVLMGGQSPEHEISLQSGRAVLNALDHSLYTGRGVVIGRNGLWTVFGESAGVPEGPEAYAGGIRPEDAAGLLRDWGVSVVFPALHGPYGEDGSIQGFLKILGITCAASGVCASALSLDKHLSKSLVAARGLLTAPDLIVRRGTWDSDPDGVLEETRSRIGFPCFVKAIRLGSSVGVYRVASPEKFPEALGTAFETAAELMVERFIPGREISVVVLGNAGEALRALPPVEIRPCTAEFFDYGAKYEPGGAEEICPAPLDEALTLEACEKAESVHDLIGARGFSRTDFIVNEEGIWFLELNSIPGLTPQSILPKAAAAGGIEFQDLVSMIVEFALEPSGRADPRSR